MLLLLEGVGFLLLLMVIEIVGFVHLIWGDWGETLGAVVGLLQSVSVIRSPISVS